ncbi:MAG TPA: glycosyltransferase [Candidatus Saccharimonadales bacterium]|nr:glycosyltransferase [Candidatus Saccharimonadales bacterium]
MKQSAPTVSVVIPAYNEATYIDRLLHALSRQSFKDFDVIVSDAESKDGTDKVVKNFEDRLDIKFVESPPKGPAHGRNIGAKQAKGEWLLFLDADDDIDDPNFIKVLVSKTKSKGWNTASTKMKFRHKKGLWVLYKYQKLLAHTKRPVASGYCILTRRSLFEKNGGFNEKIKFGEDYEYVSRVGKYGFGFVDDTFFYMDPRRNESEGFKLIYKGTLNEIHRLFFGYEKLEKNPINYEFGKHKKRGD